MIRIFDFFISLLGLVLFFPVFFLVLILGYLDTGSPFFFQKRVGMNREPFILIKFRTMKRGTPSVGTHLADSEAVTRLGSLLRKSKLDELPQLWNVLTGSMSLVGPRPCLYNQTVLIHERDSRGIFEVRPGITGLAQIKKIDMSTPVLLAETEDYMIKTMSLLNYFRFIFATVCGKGIGDRVGRA